MPEEIVRQYLFDRPGLYQIRVVGMLEARWSEHLEGLEISNQTGNRYTVTEIKGWVADQTALGGLLDLLNDLGMVILTVERVAQGDELI